jgi:hypothetical protein
MSDKEKFKDKKGTGFEPIPEPDHSRLGQAGATAKVEDIVGGIVNNVQKSLTGDSAEDSGKDRSKKDKFKEK